MNTNPFQFRYRVFINGKDITSDVRGDVQVESTPDMVGHCTFKLKGFEYLTNARAARAGASGSIGAKDVVKMYDKVVLEGGAGEGTGNYAVLFSGFIRYIRSVYSNSGTLEVSIEALDMSYRGASNVGYHVYPSSTPKRPWAAVANLTASQVVRYLAQDMGLVIGQDQFGKEAIQLTYDLQYTKFKPLVQRNESDWQVLRKLGDRLNCSVWTEYNQGNTELFFIDKSILREPKNGSEIKFKYALRANNTTFVYDRMDSGEFPIWDVQIEQDFAAMSEVGRVITSFDYSTGQEINVFEARLQENGKEVVKYFTFEVDQDKIRTLSPDARRNLEDMASSIAGGEGSYDINQIAKYFKPARFIDDKRNFLVDKPYLGITITCVADGNVNIRPRRNYYLSGIARYGSDSLGASYYCRSITHVFSELGFLTQMEFIL